MSNLFYGRIGNLEEMNSLKHYFTISAELELWDKIDCGVDTMRTLPLVRWKVHDAKNRWHSWYWIFQTSEQKCQIRPASLAPRHCDCGDVWANLQILRRNRMPPNDTTATVTFGKGKKYSTIQLMHYTRFSETTRLSISILFFALVRYRNGVRIFKSLPLPNLTDVAEVGQSYFFILKTLLDLGHAQWRGPRGLY